MRKNKATLVLSNKFFSWPLLFFMLYLLHHEAGEKPAPFNQGAQHWHAVRFGGVIPYFSLHLSVFLSVGLVVFRKQLLGAGRCSHLTWQLVCAVPRRRFDVIPHRAFEQKFPLAVLP